MCCATGLAFRVEEFDERNRGVRDLLFPTVFAHEGFGGNRIRRLRLIGCGDSNTNENKNGDKTYAD